jgi:glycosyltransferase involved in cell wall biosynthesis
MKNITYIFSQNRKKNYANNNNYAKDFYYGLHNFDNKKDKEIEVIEYSDNKTFLYPLLLVFDKFINKFLSLPFYSSKLTNLENLKKFLKADYLFLVNEGVGFSAIFLLFITKIFKRVKVSIFVMGLYSKKVRFERFKFIHLFTIKLLVLVTDNILFLGESEYKKANNTHKKYNEKFKFLPFCIDTKFWTNNTKKDITKNENIIFVGNDGNRDFELLIKLAHELRELNFIVVSSSEIFQKVNLPNVKIYDGFWGNEEITDSDLRNLYLEAKLSIIPLKESFQPSGQSVALQSMSLGIPVIITKTSGFWQKEIFVDNENILFINGFNYKSWVNKINEIYNDNSTIRKISENARSTVLDNYKLNKLYDFLDQITK